MGRSRQRNKSFNIRSHTQRRQESLQRNVPTEREMQFSLQQGQMLDSRRNQIETHVFGKAQYALNILTQVNPNAPKYPEMVDAASEYLIAHLKHGTAQIQALPIYEDYDPDEDEEEDDEEDDVAVRNAVREAAVV